jgi:hypothetical protein
MTVMRFHVLAVALVASVALASPADAAGKKRKKVAHPANLTAVQPKTHSQDVYTGGELVGRDPDPFIRLMMLRYPHAWDGPD